MLKRELIQNPDNQNNLFSTFYMNNYLNKLKEKFKFINYNYANNQDYYQFLSSFFCVSQKYIYYNWSSDYIIKDLFFTLQNISQRDKNIWFEKPNYKMIEIYSKLFKYKILDNYKKADIIYLTFPNINLPFKQTKFKSLVDVIKFINTNKNKLIIIDFAYYNNYFSLKKICEIIKKLLKRNIFIIFSFTKLTGNANVKQGILITKNKLINKINLFANPHRISQFQKFLITHLNKKILDKHRINLLKAKNKLLEKFEPDFIHGFNLFFKEEKFKAKYISKIDLYRYSIKNLKEF